MHPPFHLVDHRIDHHLLPAEEHRVIRRSRPEHLCLSLPGPGMPLVIVTPVRPPRPLAVGFFARIMGMMRRRQPKSDLELDVQPQ